MFNNNTSGAAKRNDVIEAEEMPAFIATIDDHNYQFGSAGYQQQNGGQEEFPAESQGGEDAPMPKKKKKLIAKSFDCEASLLKSSSIVRIPPNDSFGVFGSFEFQVLYGDVKIDGYKSHGKAFDHKNWFKAEGNKVNGIIAFLNLTNDYQKKNKLSRLRWRLSYLCQPEMVEKIMRDYRNNSAYVVIRESQSKLTTIWNEMATNPGMRLDGNPHGYQVLSKMMINTQITGLNLFTNVPHGPLSIYDQEVRKGLHETVIRTLVNVAANVPISYAEEPDSIRTDQGKQVLLIKGPTNCGKSTLLRYIANTLLTAPSAAKGGKIGYLDTDVGQTEFTPPGNITLSRLSGPLFGPTVCHFDPNPMCSYYYGDISPSSRHQAYFDMIRSCYNEFEKDPKMKILLVNTCGWIDGIGAWLLEEIDQIVRPTLKIELHRKLNGPNISVFEKDDNSRLIRIAQRINFGLQGVDGRTIRDLGVIQSLLDLYAFPDPESFVTSSPLSIPFSDLALWFHSPAPTSQVLSIINGSYVALCAIKNSEVKESAQTRHIYDDPSLPRLIPTAEDGPLIRWLGAGIVRGVCMNQKRVYLLTAVDRTRLERVNCLAIGNISLPDRTLRHQPDYDRAPYLLGRKKKNSSSAKTTTKTDAAGVAYDTASVPPPPSSAALSSASSSASIGSSASNNNLLNEWELMKPIKRKRDISHAKTHQLKRLQRGQQHDRADTSGTRWKQQHPKRSGKNLVKNSTKAIAKRMKKSQKFFVAEKSHLDRILGPKRGGSSKNNDSAAASCGRSPMRRLQNKNKNNNNSKTAASAKNNLNDHS